VAAFAGLSCSREVDKMEKIRTPLFVVALILLGLAVLIEMGSTALLSRLGVDGAEAAVSAGELVGDSLQYFPEDIRGEIEDVLGDEDTADEISEADVEDVPGFGIPYMMLLDGILFFTVALIGVALVMPDYAQGKLQGVATLIFSILIILAAIGMIFAAIAAVTVMVVLLLAIPFGTIVYLIKYGSFDRGGASAILSLLMFLKFGFTVCLILAHQRFLQGKGLMLIILTSFIANIIVAFLHGLVPRILVSITDVIAGIVVAVIAVIWAVILLIGSIPAVIKAVKKD
jgi:hypothetical protein